MFARLGNKSGGIAGSQGSPQIDKTMAATKFEVRQSISVSSASTSDRSLSTSNMRGGKIFCVINKININFI